MYKWAEVRDASFLGVIVYWLEKNIVWNDAEYIRYLETML